ncbi:hypothetical protein GCM10011390_35750 [Aureimonas endophytica]|uniref:Phage-Barnase-EndoU-ColicinE5/D-RelE like nuclease 3 domain-containing protein n=1 Tax=Aureimonas endophytica TaxID=2027858 RepID=A0A917E849_9HYPH|nr:hypothetical protein [Aureimonas endophytica]GGE13502.1 hypothetical protein GCM10011390_35750 [Aureimonas endophytica]
MAGDRPATGARNRRIRNLVNRALKKRDGIVLRRDLGPVGNGLAIMDATGIDVTGFRRVLDSGKIRKVMKDHGDPLREQSRRPPQIAIDRKDFERIPQIVESAFRISGGWSSKRGPTSLKYEARIGSNLYIYVETVRTGQRHVALKTMWKRKPV